MYLLRVWWHNRALVAAASDALLMKSSARITAAIPSLSWRTSVQPSASLAVYPGSAMTPELMPELQRGGPQGGPRAGEAPASCGRKTLLSQSISFSSTRSDGCDDAEEVSAACSKNAVVVIQ